MTLHTTVSTFLSQSRDALDRVLFETIFDENASLGDLAKLVAVLATFIFITFTILERPLSWLVNGPLKETMWSVVELEFNRPDKLETQELFGVTTKQQFFDIFVVGLWPSDVLIIAQHLIGGLFSVPSVLGIGSFSKSTRTSLACLAIISEMSWEIQDLCKMFFYRLFMGKEGKKWYPTLFVAAVTMHHCLTCVMGLPVILNYRGLPEVHRMVFDLEFAGGLFLLMGQISRTLDVTKKKDLRVFVLVSTLMLLLIGWTRVFDWFYLVYKLLARFYADENWPFLIVGSFVLFIFSLFNIFAAAIPVYQRFAKFMKKLREYESLPADTTAERRRSTIYDLQLAAAELATIETRFDEAILNIFEDRKVKRRHTFNSASLSRSAMLAAASADWQSMVAWRGMPSRVKARAEKKAD